MRRSTALVLVVLGAAFAGFVLSSAAVRLQDEDAPAQPSVAAGPQTAALGWRETFGPAGAARLRGRADPGAQERVAGLARAHERHLDRVQDRRSAPDAQPSLRADALRDGRRRRARATEQRRNAPDDPGCDALRAGPTLDSRTRSLLARNDLRPGALVAGSWARVVFGTLLAVGAPPGDTDDELEERVAWITDHSYRLQR